MLSYLGFELRRLTRDPRFLLLTTLIPLGMYLFFGSYQVHSTHGPVPMRSRILEMVGMACYAGLMVTITNGGNIAADRALGWIAQLRTTPIGVRGITVAKMGSGLVLSLPAIALIYLIGGIIQEIQLTPLQWTGLVLVTWIGTLPFALLGMSLGYLSTPLSAGPMVMASTLGLAALGGLWIPVADLPDALRHLANFLPASGWSDIPERIALHQAFEPRDVIRMLGWSFAFTLAARSAYRRGTPQ